MSVVIDSSALLAVLWSEPGFDLVMESLEGAKISAVNFAEVSSKLVDREATSEELRRIIKNFSIEVIAFDETQAIMVGNLRKATRSQGLSIGDRACIGLAIAEGATVLTADRAWAKLDLGVEITLIR